MTTSPRDGMREIVGVVGDVKLRASRLKCRRNIICLSSRRSFFRPAIIIRTSGDPLSMVGPLRDQLARVDKIFRCTESARSKTTYRSRRHSRASRLC